MELVVSCVVGTEDPEYHFGMDKVGPRRSMLGSALHRLFYSLPSLAFGFFIDVKGEEIKRNKNLASFKVPLI